MVKQIFIQGQHQQYFLFYTFTSKWDIYWTARNSNLKISNQHQCNDMSNKLGSEGRPHMFWPAKQRLRWSSPARMRALRGGESARESPCRTRYSRPACWREWRYWWLAGTWTHPRSGRRWWTSESRLPWRQCSCGRPGTAGSCRAAGTDWTVQCTARSRDQTAGRRLRSSSPRTGRTVRTETSDSNLYCG